MPSSATRSCGVVSAKPCRQKSSIALSTAPSGSNCFGLPMPGTLPSSVPRSQELGSVAADADTAPPEKGRGRTAPFGPRPVSIRQMRHDADGGDPRVETMAADLITKARAGDGEAFRELTGPHHRELLVHCYRMLGSFQDAEDALQDTLLAAWRGLDGYAARASLRTWLYRIATNTCLNARRSAAR